MNEMKYVLNVRPRQRAYDVFVRAIRYMTHNTQDTIV